MLQNAGNDERTVSAAAISATIVQQSIDKLEFFKNGNICVYNKLKSINNSSSEKFF